MRAVARVVLLVGTLLWASTGLACFAGGSPAATAPGQAGGDRPLVRLLAYAPQEGGPVDAEWLWYSNLAEVKRLTGADRARGEADQPSALSRNASWRDVQRQVPLSDFLPGPQDDSWQQAFGFGLFDVDYALQVGQPSRHFRVIQGAINAQVTGRRLAEVGYVPAPSGLNAQAQLYARRDDHGLDLHDPIPSLRLADFNRVVLAPGLFIAGPASNIVQEVVDAATGRRPNLAADPAVRLVATAMDDPALLPGTTLLGAMMLSTRVAYSLSPPGVPLRFDELGERALESSPQPLVAEEILPVYGRLGIGFRRGARADEGYWLFTLAYDDASEARQAAGALDNRIRHYRSGRTRQPLVGAEVAEVLPTVLQEGPSGASVSLVLRLPPGTETSWLALVDGRDLGFLAPGQMRLPP